jgi:hypothetical protein
MRPPDTARRLARPAIFGYKPPLTMPVRPFLAIGTHTALAKATIWNGKRKVGPVVRASPGEYVFRGGMPVEIECEPE